MSEEDKPEFLWYADRAKTGRAGCKKCKQKIDVGALRMAKTGNNPFGSGLIKMWHHLDCMFEVFAKQRASTAKIECVDDIGGWDQLSEEDQEEILKRLPESVRAAGRKAKKPEEDEVDEGESTSKPDYNHKDNSFREYRRLLAEIAAVPGYLDKTAKTREFITKGTDGESFKGDLGLWIRLLLPGVIKRVYNLQAKQIIKLFSRIFLTDQDEMLEDLEQGDIAETIKVFFEKSSKVKPSQKSTLTLHDVDQFLEYLSKLTREEDQINHFNKIIPRCTSNDLKAIIRLLRHDLRINAGAKHILDAVHEDAYEAFQASRDINAILEKVGKASSGGKKGQKQNLTVNIAPMVPVLPMLAQPCKSSDEALQKCPNGMYSEVKYDGERVQVHKSGNVFKYYSRSLKPVLQHKVKPLEPYFAQAFPFGDDLILDSEILMIDTNTGKPLPFGTLGIHKKGEFKDATVCLFVFDCIYYNGKSLLNEPIYKRRRILHEQMKQIDNHIVFSEMKEIHDKKDLETMMTEVFRQGLEGLVLKDLMLLMHGPYFGRIINVFLFVKDATPQPSQPYVSSGPSGMMSVFLMGCYDERSKCWCTVTKVHTGHDDATLERLQTELGENMIKISKDMNKVPSWLRCTKTMVPDFVAKDPKLQPVWEITGAEFTQNVVHTADGISVRFPRVTRIRSDKDWAQATSLAELREIYKKSKETSDFTLGEGTSDHSPSVSPTKSPRKRPASTTPTSSPKKIPKKMNTTSPKIVASKKRPLENTLPPTTSKIFKKDNKIIESKEMKMRVLKTLGEDKIAAESYNLKYPLPDVFIGVRLFFPEAIPQDQKDCLEQYFVAFGGELLKKDEKGKATHEVDVGDLDWLWKSLREQKLTI
nr:DNA ligase 3 [Halyomorpha halys]